MLKNFLLVLSLVLFSSIPASSREITNGTVEVQPSFGFVFFEMNFSGADFSVHAGAGNLVGTAFAPCVFGGPQESAPWFFS
jgi:hypothetical protein